MRLLLAPDSLKESLTAEQAVCAMQRGAEAAGRDELELDPCPLSDGGEGFVAALSAALPSMRIARIQTRGPDPQDPAPQAVSLGVLDDEDRTGASGATVFVEMAQSAGLWQVPKDRRDPERLTTYGVGQAIAAALDHDPPRIVLGVGGSATVDGGAGMVQALGGAFFRRDGPIDPPIVGGQLPDLERVDLSGLDARLQGVRLEVWCDVDNPLVGERGAARVFGPQKGAGPEAVERLDLGLTNLARCVERDCGKAVADVPGGGAAGGISAGAVGMLGAEIVPGSAALLDAVGFDARAARADLVLTGEGSLDAQSEHGKLVSELARRCRGLGRPVVVLAGRLEAETVLLERLGVAGVVELGAGLSLEDAIAAAPERMDRAVRRVVRAWPSPAPGCRAICWSS
ncbi:MAG: glycerate kinase [Planctomycetota bacterium]